MSLRSRESTHSEVPAEVACSNRRSPAARRSRGRDTVPDHGDVSRSLKVRGPPPNGTNTSNNRHEPAGMVSVDACRFTAVPAVSRLSTTPS